MTAVAGRIGLSNQAPQRRVNGLGHGNEEVTSMQADSTQRFWTKVDRRGPDECWNWLGSKDEKGYGRFSSETGVPRGAHRIAYELVVGPIPLHLQLDHLCRNPSCVNPAHLEAVTGAENVRRGDAAKLTADDARAIRLSDRPHTELADEYGVHPGTILHVRKWHTWADIEDERGLIPLPDPVERILRDHCPHGHPLSGDNLYLHPSKGRCCRECRRENGRRYRRKQKAIRESIDMREPRTTRERLLEALEADRGQTTSELSKALSPLTAYTIGDELRRMHREGLADRRSDTCDGCGRDAIRWFLALSSVPDGEGR